MIRLIRLTDAKDSAEFYINVDKIVTVRSFGAVTTVYHEPFRSEDGALEWTDVIETPIEIARLANGIDT